MWTWTRYDTRDNGTFTEWLIPNDAGVPHWASGPFYSYTTGFSPSEVQDALSRLDRFVEENGPFDGVFGFSLGSALAIAYILDRQQRHASPPFSFAVFFSPIFVASPDAGYCTDLLARMLDDDHAAFRAAFPDGDFAPLLDAGASSPGDSVPAAAKRTFAEYLQTVLSMHSTMGMILPNTRLDFFSGGRLDAIPRLLHPLLTKSRVRIPVVCVTGGKDSPAIAEQSRVAKELCMAPMTQVYKHARGHDIPFQKSDVQAIVSLIEITTEIAFD